MTFLPERIGQATVYPRVPNLPQPYLVALFLRVRVTQPYLAALFLRVNCTSLPHRKKSHARSLHGGSVRVVLARKL